MIQFLLDCDWICFCSWDLSAWRYRFDCSKCDSRGNMEKEKTVNTYPPSCTYNTIIL